MTVASMMQGDRGSFQVVYVKAPQGGFGGWFSKNLPHPLDPRESPERHERHNPVPLETGPNKKTHKTAPRQPVP